MDFNTVQRRLDLLDNGALNSLDLLGRSVGLVAHGYLVAAVGEARFVKPGTSFFG